MGLFNRRGSASEYDFRSRDEIKIEKESGRPLAENLEQYAEEILAAFARRDFENASKDSSACLYQDEHYNFKGSLRDTAESIGKMRDLQKVYYRVVFLARKRGVDIAERYMSVLFDRIDGWMD